MKTQEEVKTFLDKVAETLYISNPTDWFRISRLQVASKGGMHLLKKFGNLGYALQYAYPEGPFWDLKSFSHRSKKSIQRWLCICLQQLLPLPYASQVLEDFVHQELIWDIDRNIQMQLDIWVPDFNLALEYQGEQHYYDIPSRDGPGGSSKVFERDQKKKVACLNHGITLLCVPFWWDRSVESLCSSLHTIRPDIFERSSSPPISESTTFLKT